MKHADLDVELETSLDGADIADGAPEPDDDDLRARLRTHPRAAVRLLPQMRRDEHRPHRPRLAGRR